MASVACHTIAVMQHEEGECPGATFNQDESRILSWEVRGRYGCGISTRTLTFLKTPSFW